MLIKALYDRTIDVYGNMSERPFKTNAPFGIATKRFANIGFHPGLDVSGSYKKTITEASPNTYYPEYQKCKYKNGVDWTLQLRSEERSKYLDFKVPKLLHEKEFRKTMLGPGTHEVCENAYKRCECNVLPDVGFGSSNRFKLNKHIVNQPPPNTYFRKISEISTINIKQLTKVPTFEWDGKQPRFKHDNRKQLPPNRYNIKDNKNTDSITKKVVSIRGPYNLFTGPRDNSTIKNYFAPPMTKTPDYYYIKPSDLDYLLKNRSKAKYGVFLTDKRFPKKPIFRHMLDDISLCYREPDEPGPAHYNLSNFCGINELPPGLYPFNMCVQNARPPPNWTIFPGPGRYNPRTVKTYKVKKKGTSVFLSKTERKFYTITNYSNF